MLMAGWCHTKFSPWKILPLKHSLSSSYFKHWFFYLYHLMHFVFLLGISALLLKKNVFVHLQLRANNLSLVPEVQICCIAHWLQSLNPDPVSNTRMSDCLQQAYHLGMKHLGQVSFVSPRVAELSTSFSRGKCKHVTSAGWQVTLCDSTWHASSHSGGVS